MFGLHFVEGLPDNNVRNYRFTFMGKHYSISTVIQYCQKLKHFVTWIANSDGKYFKTDSVIVLFKFFKPRTSCKQYLYH